MEEFRTLLHYLEKEVAPQLLHNDMQPFPTNGTDTIFACPWLRWWDRHATHKNIEGIMIMQDWWNCSNSLEEDVRYIATRKFDYKEDRTNRNLHEATKWKDVIWQHKTWLVTNAVWGLRIRDEEKHKRGEQSGCLSAKTHKAAFSIWSQIIKHFANSAEFAVVFAGAWCASPNERTIWEGKALDSFLEHWKLWAGKGTGRNPEVVKLDFQSVKGRCYFSPHPSTGRALKGPPSGLKSSKGLG